MGASEIFIDLESRSETNLKKVGAWEYSIHPSTEILCFGWEDGFGYCGVSYEFEKPPTNVENRVIVAHNSGFERPLWDNILVKRFGWPEIRPENWRCTASICRANGYPGALEQAALALNLTEQKDKTGAALMQRMSKPIPKWTRSGKGPKWYGGFDELQRLGDYCLQDVHVTKEIWKKLGPLSPKELAVWQLTELVNVRGIAVDRDLVVSACDMLDLMALQARERVKEITFGAVGSPSEAEKVRRYLSADNCQRKTLEKILGNTTDPGIKELIDLRISDSRAANKKYFAIRSKLGTTDDLVRDGFVYYGAHTGRWTSEGDQRHNLKRPEYDRFTVENIIIPAIKRQDTELIEALFGDVAKPMSSCIRSVFVASPGCDLICADYNSIEAVILMWLVDDLAGLKRFAEGKDIYIDTASMIYNKPYDQIPKKSKERLIGKIARLGLGYGMGVNRFIAYAKQEWSLVIDRDFAEFVIRTFRGKNPRVTLLWKQIETAALKAVQQPGRAFFGSPKGRIKLRCSADTLEMQLPSGRVFKYLKAKIVNGKYGPALAYTRRGGQVDTYGGKLAENAVQAIARDIMTDGLLAAEKAGYRFVLTVHDEIVCEVPKGFGSVEEFCQLICSASPWAIGCPIKAEGWRGERYRK